MVPFLSKLTDETFLGHGGNLDPLGSILSSDIDVDSCFLRLVSFLTITCRSFPIDTFLESNEASTVLSCLPHSKVIA